MIEPIELFPQYAIVTNPNEAGTGIVAVTCDILLTQNGEPLLTQDGKYIATQGLVT